MYFMISEWKRFIAEAKDDYKLRTFEVKMDLVIDPFYGVENTLSDIRSLLGVTIVAPIETVERAVRDKTSVVIKFHPQKDSDTPSTYVNNLRRTINSGAVPGTIVDQVFWNTVRQIS